MPDAFDAADPATEAGLLRHIDACRNVVLPGDRRRLTLGGHPIGWTLPAMLEAAGCDAALPDAAALERASRRLRDRGLIRWRDERFDVRDEASGAVVATVDRGALPAFGIVAEGVHLNGLVETAEGPLLWVGERMPDRPLDGGKLDHLVAGGMPAGLDARATLLKEAAEEAGIPADLAAQAVPVATIAYAMQRPEGLRRDRLYCFDLAVPETWRPRAVDGEVAGFTLRPLAAVLRIVAAGDAFKFNVNLVLIDLGLRRGLIPPGGAAGQRLRAALSALSTG